jgi:hypothetical protein
VVRRKENKKRKIYPNFFFFFLGAHAAHPMTTPSMVLNTGGKKRKGKIPKIVATFVCASVQGQRTHSARTNLLKIVATFVYASSQG